MDNETLLQQIKIVWKSDFFGITIEQMAIATAIFLGFVFLRRLFARVIIHRLRALVKRTENTFDDAVIHSLEQPLMFLFLITGLFLAITWIPFSADVTAILRRVQNSLIAFTIFWTLFRIIDPLSRGFNRLLTRVAGDVANEVRDYLLKALKVFIVGSGIVAVLAQWGIDPWPYFAGIGVLSLPFAFAAKDAVANIFGGIKLLIIDRVFKVGDWIEAPSIGHGVVEEMGLSSVKIRKFTKAAQTVPNGLLVAEPITNWSRMTHRRIKMDIGLTYDTSKAQFERILQRIRDYIAADARIDHSVTEMVHMAQFGESSIDINLYYFTKTTDWAEWRAIIEEHMLAFMGIIEEEGSAIAFPTRTLHIEGLDQPFSFRQLAERAEKGGQGGGANPGKA